MSSPPGTARSAPRGTTDDARWRRILSIHAENLATLNGSYWIGPDVGMTSADATLDDVFGSARARGISSEQAALDLAAARRGAAQPTR
ncbi:hypothetical protein [Aeromicrobium sp.]|uniref:hypothetical protein n=1 Tax=Aeromicrobium sp. TaxID=1871063 RepID=UPI003C578383